MANLLEQGAKYLLTGMQSAGGVNVTYRRGDQSVTLRAVPGRVPTVMYDERGGMFRVVIRDFIFDRKDFLVFDPQHPKRGDQIISSIDGQDEVFLVQSEDLGTPHYEEADSYGVAWRVHTKRDKDA